MRLPLLLLLRHPRGLELRQPPPNGPRLLRAQVEREIFLALVEEAQLRALLGVDVSEDAGDGFTEVVAGWRGGALVQVENRVTESYESLGNPVVE